MTTRTAKLFNSGRSQAVWLPGEFRFEGREVFVRRDQRSGDVILSTRPNSWDALFSLYDKGEVPDDFMGPADRTQPPQDCDPITGGKK